MASRGIHFADADDVRSSMATADAEDSHRPESALAAVASGAAECVTGVTPTLARPWLRGREESRRLAYPRFAVQREAGLRESFFFRQRLASKR